MSKLVLRGMHRLAGDSEHIITGYLPLSHEYFHAGKGQRLISTNTLGNEGGAQHTFFIGKSQKILNCHIINRLLFFLCLAALKKHFLFSICILFSSKNVIVIKKYHDILNKINIHENQNYMLVYKKYNLNVFFLPHWHIVFHRFTFIQ